MPFTHATIYRRCILAQVYRKTACPVCLGWFGIQKRIIPVQVNLTKYSRIHVVVYVVHKPNSWLKTESLALTQEWLGGSYLNNKKTDDCYQ